MVTKRPYPESHCALHHRASRIAALNDGRLAVLTEPGFEATSEVRLHLLAAGHAGEGMPGAGLMLVGPNEAVFACAPGAVLCAGLWPDAQDRLILAWSDGQAIHARRTREPVGALEKLGQSGAWTNLAVNLPEADDQTHLGGGAPLPGGGVALALLQRPSGRIIVCETDGPGAAVLHAHRQNHTPTLTADPDGHRLHVAWDTEHLRIWMRTIDTDAWRRGRVQPDEPTEVWHGVHDPDIITDGRQILVTYTGHMQRIKYGYFDGAQWQRDRHVNTKHPRFETTIDYGSRFWIDRDGVIHLSFVCLTRGLVYDTRWLSDAFSDPQPVEGLFHPSPFNDEMRVKAERVAVDRHSGAVLLSSTFLPERHGVYRQPVPEVRLRPDDAILWLDMQELAQATNLEPQLETMRPDPAEPILEPTDDPKDCDSARVLNGGTVLEDGGRYRMWYTALPIETDPDLQWFDQITIGYAESADGVHWQRTDTGLDAQYHGQSAPHLLRGLDHNACVFIDPEDTPDRRYKAIKFEGRAQRQVRVAERGEPGYLGPPWYGWLATSPDGFQWQREWISMHFPGPDPYGFTPQKALHDPEEPDPKKRYKAIGFVSMVGKRRCAALAYSPDAIHWTAAARLPELDSMAIACPPILSGNYNQIHDAGMYRYGRYLLAFYQLQFTPDSADIRLAVSRDGEHFNYVQPETPLVAQGEAGAWNSGYLMPADLVVDDATMALYYGSNVLGDHAQKHGMPQWRVCAGRAVAPRDRFVRLSPRQADQPARLMTVPITLDDAERPLRLTINARLGAKSELRVGLVDADAPDRPLPGYEIDSAQPITGDALDHTARWRAEALLPTARRFRVVMQLQGDVADAVYGLRIRRSPG